MNNTTYFLAGKRIAGGDGPIIGGQLTHRRANLAISPTPISPYRACRTTLQRRFRSGPTAPIYIQFLRDDNGLLGLEMNEAVRLLKIIKASHECAAAQRSADLLLRGIARGRQIFDQHPMVSEIGKQIKSAPIYIHDAVWLAILGSIITTSRANGGRDD